jgi:carbamoyltransferase
VQRGKVVLAQHQIDDAARHQAHRLSKSRCVARLSLTISTQARVQTVHAETNPRYHSLISTFKRRTGCAVLVNTSLNVRGEPIVCTPEDAFRCFMGTEMEMLVAGDCILTKGEQNEALAEDYKNQFELD